MKFVISDSIKHAISTAARIKGLSGQEATLAITLQSAEAISLSELSTLSQILRSHADASYKGPKWVHELLNKSEPYFEPPPPIKEKDPKLVARLKKLEAELENRKYMRMVKDVSFLKQREADLDRIELRSMKSQASIGYNIIFTTLTAFAVGWFIGRYYFGDGTTAIVMGAILAILALVGETLLFVISGTRHDKDAHQREVETEKGLISPFGSAAMPQDQISIMETLTDAPLSSIAAKED